MYIHICWAYMYMYILIQTKISISWSVDKFPKAWQTTQLCWFKWCHVAQPMCTRCQYSWPWPPWSVASVVSVRCQFITSLQTWRRYSWQFSTKLSFWLWTLWSTSSTALVMTQFWCCWGWHSLSHVDWYLWQMYQWSFSSWIRVPKHFLIGWLSSTAYSVWVICTLSHSVFIMKEKEMEQPSITTMTIMASASGSSSHSFSTFATGNSPLE